MSPDDPRHGSPAGHNAGCRCEPCCAAKLAYDKRRRFDLMQGRDRTIPAWRLTRRIEALQTRGWSLRAIAAEAGVTHNHLVTYGRSRNRVYAAVFYKIDDAYERLAMKEPRQVTRGEKSGVARTKNFARRNGLVPPLAWIDIDDPNERPRGWCYTTTERADMIRDLADLGANATEACRRLKLSRDALERWCQRNGMADVYRKLAAREAVAENQHTREDVA